MRTREAIAGSIELWSWTDGWRLVRPSTDAAFRRMYEEISSHVYQRPEPDQLRDWSAWMGRQLRSGVAGACGVAFLLRPIPAPAGRPELGDAEQLSAVLSFVVLPDGLLKICAYPGNYARVSAEVLRHLYDVLLGLRGVTSESYVGTQSASSLVDATDAQEQLLQPRRLASAHLLADIAKAMHGVPVTSLSTGGGGPWQTVDGRASDDGCWVVLLDRRSGLRLASDLRKPLWDRYKFQVSVPPESLPLGGALPWAPHTEKDPWVVRAKKNWSDGGSEFIPFVVEVPFWGETARHEVLEEALVRAGIVARDREDVISTLRRRSVAGTPHPSFEVSLLLGVVPDLLVAPWDELPSLVAS